MIKFKLIEENTPLGSNYVISLDFNGHQDLFDWWNENNNFQSFMEEMKDSLHFWFDINYITTGIDNDGIEYVGLKSYEIKDFQLAIDSCNRFFQNNNKLI